MGRKMTKRKGKKRHRNRFIEELEELTPSDMMDIIDLRMYREAMKSAKKRKVGYIW